MKVIYTLSTEATGVFYIGRTSYPLKKRLQSHFKDLSYEGKRNKNKEKCDILKSCKQNGAKVHIEELDSILDDKDSNILETYWICQFEVWGFNLVNRNQTISKTANLIIHNGKNKYSSKKHYDYSHKQYYKKVERINGVSINILNKRDVNNKPNGYEKIPKILLSDKEKLIIKNKKKFGDATIIAEKLGTVCSEMIRLCLNGRIMRTEIYDAIKEYYKF